MPWSAGTFTRTYGSTGWQGDAAAGTPIVADRHDTNDQDLATGINACLNKDGSNSMTANLNMGGFIPTNLGAGTAAAPAFCAGNDQDTGMYSPAANQIGIATNGTERMRITSSGSVGIGNVSPSSILDVGDGTGQKIITCSAGNSGAAGGSSFWCRNGGVTQSAFGGWSSIIGGAYDATTTVWAAGAMRVVSGGGANERITLTSTGNVGIGGINPSYLLQLNTDSAAKPTTNTWTIASDERIKTNIQPYGKGLEEILQVEPITYDYNGKGGIPAGPGGISILAQALQPIFPECIGSYKGKLNEEDEEDTDILNYNGHAMTFALINAVKELSTKLDALTERVEALEV